jgi:hypothetical protein
VLVTILFVAALISGIIGIVKHGVEDWASWGVILIAGGLLVGRL